MLYALAPLVLALPSPDVEAAVEASRSALEHLRAELDVPGLAVALALDGELLWTQGFGEASEGVAAGPRTRFRLGSVSKLFTAAAAARLVQRGDLDLDVPVQEYVDFPEGEALITTRQLLGHLGGIRHYGAKDFMGGGIDSVHFDSTQAALTIFADDPLVATPGARYAYTTFGYTLVAAVLEGATEKPFLELLQVEVFDPLGLDDLCADRAGVEVERRSSFFDRGHDGAIVPARAIDPSYKWAGGGLLGSAHDLALFGAAHVEPGFLDEETLELCFTPQATSDGVSTGVGLGWRVGQELGGRSRLVHHSGNIAGGRSTLVVYRDLGLVVALVSNLRGVPGGIDASAQALGTIFLDALEAEAQTPLPLGVFELETPEGSARLTLEAPDEAATHPLRGRWVAGDARWPVLWAAARGEVVELVLATPAGLCPLRANWDGEQLSGRLRRASSVPKPDELEFVGRR